MPRNNVILRSLKNRSVNPFEPVCIKPAPGIKTGKKNFTWTKIGSGVILFGTTGSAFLYYSKLKGEQDEIKKRIKQITVAKREGGPLLDFVQLKVLYWNLYGLDGMNPVSRKHNDALFTFVPVNVNAVFLAFFGLFPLWAYHRARIFYYLRQKKKINLKVKKTCLSRAQCCKDPQRCMTGSLSQPETMLDSIKMSRLYRYYKERANEVALLGGTVAILAMVGIGINIHDMKETQKMEKMLLSKQWGLSALEYDTTVNLLHVILSRRLDIFESDLKIVADYVQKKTDSFVQWDVPSSYLHYSPLIIMQFLFHELDLGNDSCSISSKLLGDFYVSYAASDPEIESTNGLSDWIKPSLEPYDIEFRNYLLKVRISQKRSSLAANLEREIMDQNKNIKCLNYKHNYTNDEE